MSYISESLEKVSPTALALMLVVVFLSLYEAGLDHNVLYWVLLPLSLLTALLIHQNNIFINLSIKLPLLWYLLFLMWAGISIVWSLNPHRTLVELLQLSLYGLVLISAANLSSDNILRLGRIVLILGFGISLFGLSQYIILDSSRIESTLANANTMGIYMVMLFLIGWGYYLRRPSGFLSVVSVSLLSALFLTVSRGSFICLALTLPLIFIGLEKKDIKSSVIKTILCIAIALITTQVIVLIAPLVQDLVGRNTVLSELLTRRSSFVAWSGVSRFAFWETGFRIFLNNPVTGTGLGTFFLAYFTEYIDNIWYARFVHNHYIQIMSELGIIGFGLFIAFIINIWRLALLQIRPGNYPVYFPGVIAAALAFLIHIAGDFSFNFPATAVIFFILAGIICGSSYQMHATGIISNTKKVITVALILVIFGLSAWQFYTNRLYSQGIMLEAEEKLEEAAEVYDRANSFYPINSMAFSFAASTYNRLAIKHENQQYLEEATIRAEKAVALSPVDGNLHNQLGRLYWQSGDLEKAEYHLRVASDYAAYRLGMFIDLIWFYIQQERTDDAKEVLEKAIHLKDYASGMHPSDADRERVQGQLEMLEQLEMMLK